jgi:hypothetical protein
MARALIILVRGYQALVSPVLPPNTCRFYPTCSIYAIDALKKYGALRGTLAALKRISKCHPWHHGGFDPA